VFDTLVQRAWFTIILIGTQRTAIRSPIFHARRRSPCEAFPHARDGVICGSGPATLSLRYAKASKTKFETQILAKGTPSEAKARADASPLSTNVSNA
jgi:hypothetical protein